MTGAITIGDKVRWRRDHYPKTDPEMRTEVIAVYDGGETVRLEGGATAPARMLEVVESAAAEVVAEGSGCVFTDLGVDRPSEAELALRTERNGLLQVIEAQMAEIDRLVTERDEAKATADWLGPYPDEVEGLLGQLCIALGFDRHPGLPTGIPELDALVRYVMD